MHRRLLAALMTLCLLLPASGCGGSGAEMEFEELRGKLGGAAVELGALVTDGTGGGTGDRLRRVSGAWGSGLGGKAGGAGGELGALVTDCTGGGTEYRLRCVSGAEGSELEVLAPAEIAGVRARLGAEGGAALEFEGLVLDAGAGGENPCALTALPLLCSALRSAHVALAWTEGSESVLSLVPEDEYGITLRLGEDGAPVYAEFTGTQSGETLLVCRIESFAIV